MAKSYWLNDSSVLKRRTWTSVGHLTDPNRNDFLELTFLISVSQTKYIEFLT